MDLAVFFIFLIKIKNIAFAYLDTYSQQKYKYHNIIQTINKCVKIVYVLDDKIVL